MTIKIALGIAAALFLAAQAQAQLTKPEDVGVAGDKLSLIDDVVRINIASGQIPGAIVLVARDGKVIYLRAQGAGDPAGKTPIHTDTIFPIASWSKPITAAAVLMLVDEGKIRLDDPIGKYIPELGGRRMVRVLKPGSPPLSYSPLPGVIPAASPYGPAKIELVPAVHEITIRELLTHTSGVQIFGVENAFPAPVPGDTLATRLPKLAKAPLEFQPGSAWAYSNGWGFDILGRVVEVASGMPFNRFLKQRLFDPLGMADTDFGVHADSVARATPRPDGSVETSDKVTYFSGAAGMSSTVPDYAKFVQMLADGGKANGRQFLKPETVKAMSSNEIGWLQMNGYPPLAMPHEGLRFGYGMLTLSVPMVAGTKLPEGSFGWDGIGTRRWWAVPREHLIILSMVPLIGPGAAPMQRVVEASVMSALTRRDSPPPPEGPAPR